MLESFLRDTRIGLRVLVKERSFCALAILVLALGICGVTTMFAVVDGVMIRGFSFPNAGRLVSVDFIDPASGVGRHANGRMSINDFRELAAEQRSLMLPAASRGGETVNLTINNEPKRFEGAYITADIFRMLGVEPALGRNFNASDDQPGAERVAIIAHTVWQNDFGGAPNAVGRVVRLNGLPTTIVGVMPKGFGFPDREVVWVPISSQFPAVARNDPRDVPVNVAALIKPGVSLDTATAEVTSFARRFATAYPVTNKLYTAGQVLPLIDVFTPDSLRGTLWTMLAFCAAVLLIACVNVMNMQFARATLRTKELAVRSSLGATRIRLIRQMLTESLIVAAAGAAIGTALAYYATDWLWATVHNMEGGPPTWMTFDVSGRVLAVTVFVTIAAAVVSGLLPAWTASRANAVAVLRDGSRGSTGRGVGLATRALVVLQVVVTCVLLVGSLLWVRSIVNQQKIDYGYDTQAVLTARIGLMEAVHASPESRRLFYDGLLTSLRSSPDFKAAALTSRNRMVYSGTTRIEIEGKAYKRAGDRPLANWEKVSSEYAEAIGQRVLQGRAIADEDLDNRLPVAVVNEAFVQRHFGREYGVGRRFRTVTDDEQFGPWRTIVGVVATVRMVGPMSKAAVGDVGFYLPFYGTVNGPALPAPSPSQFATVIVRPRTTVPAERLAAMLRRDVDKVDRDLPLYFVGTPAQHIDSAIAQNRVIAGMFVLFGLVAVVMASVGIYAMMSFSVNQRQQEFGVRMALGADSRRMLRMILRQGGFQLFIGLALGFGLTVLLASFGRNVLADMLFGVSPHDAFTYTAVLAVVTIVSLVAILIPGRRATCVDPMVALRMD